MIEPVNVEHCTHARSGEKTTVKRQTDRHGVRPVAVCVACATGAVYLWTVLCGLC